MATCKSGSPSIFPDKGHKRCARGSTGRSVTREGLGDRRDTPRCQRAPEEGEFCQRDPPF